MEDEDFFAHQRPPEGASALDPLYGLGVRLIHETPTPRQLSSESRASGLLQRLRASATGLLAHASLNHRD
jgi:hypothetical protein